MIEEDEFTFRPELIKKRARTLMWRRALVAISIVYMIVLMTLISISALNANEQRDLIISCTDVNGECSKANQERTTKVVKGLIAQGQARSVMTRDIVKAAVFCAKVLPPDVTEKQFSVCINERIK